VIAIRPLLLVTAAALQIAGAGAVLGQTGTIELELNTAVDAEAGCRLTYVATNNTSVALEKSSYEVAVYDNDGIVQRLLVLEFGWLPVGKTRVVQFDLPEQKCGTISRISVNGPVECSSGKGEEKVCRDNQILSSRVRTIQFN